ncbi:hypothetical protein OIU78_002486 [Salix suchowensis]|nr:hypothetical protein OIU78_002486 [Salix suchowensis]
MKIQFSSTVQASATCEPYLFYHDEVMEDGVQKFTCQATTNDSHGAEVSAVLRVIPAETDPSLARTLTGLSGLVFNAEGRWDPSTGKLCMLGCRPGDDSELKRCTLRISLYVSSCIVDQAEEFSVWKHI